MYDTYRRFSEKYYPTYRLFLGNQPVIYIRHPDDLEVLAEKIKILIINI